MAIKKQKSYLSTFLSWIGTLKSDLTEQFSFDSNYLIIVCLIGIISTFGIWDTHTQSLIAHDEGLYAGRAKLILEAKDWFAPFNNPHHKTIGSYWLIAISMKVFGFTEFSARLPSSIFSILSSLLVYLIGQEFLSKKASLYSALLLSSMPLWFQYSRYASPDIPFVFLTLLSTYFLLLTHKRIDLNKRTRYFLLISSGICLSLSFFIRSFMVALPVFSLLPFLISSRFFNYKSRLLPFALGILLGLTPTFLALFHAFSSYGSESFFSLIDFAKDKAVGGVLFKNSLSYPLNLLLLSFPIGLLSSIGIISLIKNGNTHQRIFLLSYPFISLIILMSISTRYSHYALVLYPFIALIYGHSLDHINTLNGNIALKITRLISFIAILFGILLVLISCLIYTNQITISVAGINSILLSMVFLAILYMLVGILLASRPLNVVNTLRATIILPLIQIFTLLGLYSNGIMGNPNSELKSFIRDEPFSKIFENNRIIMVDIIGKSKTLMQFYLPSYEHYNPSKHNLNNSYLLINKGSLSRFKETKEYRIYPLGLYKDIRFIRIEKKLKFK